MRKGFAVASGDMLMILDADLTMPPEDLPKFYARHRQRQRRVHQWHAAGLSDGEGRDALLNLVANRFFALVFTYLLNQRFTDTLCGTKVLSAERL